MSTDSPQARLAARLQAAFDMFKTSTRDDAARRTWRAARDEAQTAYQREIGHVRHRGVCGGCNRRVDVLAVKVAGAVAFVTIDHRDQRGRRCPGSGAAIIAHTEQEIEHVAP